MANYSLHVTDRQRRPAGRSAGRRMQQPRQHAPPRHPSAHLLPLPLPPRRQRATLEAMATQANRSGQVVATPLAHAGVVWSGAQLVAGAGAALAACHWRCAWRKRSCWQRSLPHSVRGSRRVWPRGRQCQQPAIAPVPAAGRYCWRQEWQPPAKQRVEGGERRLGGCRCCGSHLSLSSPLGRTYT